jgi:hypothetical protein
MDEPVHCEAGQDYREEKRDVDTDDHITGDCSQQRRYGIAQRGVESGKSVPGAEEEVRKALGWPMTGTDLPQELEDPEVQTDIFVAVEALATQQRKVQQRTHDNQCDGIKNSSSPELPGRSLVIA